MSQVSKITEVVQAYHDDNFDDRHAVEAAAGDMLYDMCESWGLEYPDGKLEDEFAKVMASLIEESVDWQHLADCDENARGWEEARREALYK